MIGKTNVQLLMPKNIVARNIDPIIPERSCSLLLHRKCNWVNLHKVQFDLTLAQRRKPIIRPYVYFKASEVNALR